MEKEIRYVQHIRDDIFRVNFPPNTIKADVNGLLLIGSHKLSIILDKPEKYIMSIEGSGEVILDWLKTLDISSAALAKYQKMMEEK